MIPTRETPDAPGLSVTKLDAARRQLQTAVRLYFNSADPVSTHTLTEAGYELLSNLNRKRGGPSMFREKMLDEVKPEYRKYVRDKLAEAKNFFKHADKDPESTLLFQPAGTEIALWEACAKYQELTTEVIPEFAVFMMWFYVTRGRAFFIPGTPIAVKFAEATKVFDSSPHLHTRPAFLAAMLPLAETLGPPFA